MAYFRLELMADHGPEYVINDGKPTGIESEEQYYELQKQVYGDVIIDLSWLI